MADDPYAYLSGLSQHPDRAGDTSKFNPDFAARMAAAMKQARAMGLPVSLMSGFREGNVTGSRYDMGGNSSHSYGMAGDVAGLDGPNGKITKAWAQIAEANGLHNPYGVDNAKEFNHWQLPPEPLEQTPQLLASLKEAKAGGDFQNVWSAYNQHGGSPIAPNPQPIRAASSPVTPLGGDHAAFIRNYAQSIGLDPNLALGIGRAEGMNAWSASNPNAGSYVDRAGGQPFSFGDFQLNVRNGMGVDALRAGIDPRDPKQWQAADRFALDRMKAGGVGPWKGDPVAAAYLKSGATPASPQAPGRIDPSIVAQGGTSPDIPGTTLTSTAAPAATGPLAAIGGLAKDKDFLSNIKKATGGGGGQDEGPLKPVPFVGGEMQPTLHNTSQLGGQMLQGGMPAQLSQAVTGYQPPQMYGTGINSMAAPAQWGSAPPGQNPWANAGLQAPGTSLASQQQLQALYAGLNQDPFGGYAYG